MLRGKRNDETLLDRWRQLLKFFDIKGGVIIGLFSLEMLAIIAYYAVKGREIPTTVEHIYLGVLTAFTTHGVAKVIKGAKDATEE